MTKRCPPFRKKITQNTLAEFTQQLATLFNANLEFFVCLQILSQNHEFPALRDLINHIKSSIENGSTVSAAFRQFSSCFDSTYCALIAAGESSGTLKEILKQLSHYLRKKLLIRNKIIKAVYYPIIVLNISLLITLGLLIFVVPQFKNIFDSFGAKLPTLTLQIIDFSHYLQANILYIIEFFLISILLHKKYFNKKFYYQYLLHTYILKLPVLGQFLRQWYAQGWLRLLATLLSSGVTLVDAIELSMQTITNLYYQKILSEIKLSIVSGNSFLHSIQGKFIFPIQVVQMIRVGESSGQLSQMLLEAADMLQRNIEHKVELYAQWSEPVLMLILAVLVGGLIIAMYLPVFRLGSTL